MVGHTVCADSDSTKEDTGGRGVVHAATGRRKCSGPAVTASHSRNGVEENSVVGHTVCADSDSTKEDTEGGVSFMQELVAGSAVAQRSPHPTPGTASGTQSVLT